MSLSLVSFILLVGNARELAIVLRCTVRDDQHPLPMASLYPTCEQETPYSRSHWETKGDAPLGRRSREGFPLAAYGYPEVRSEEHPATSTPNLYSDESKGVYEAKGLHRQDPVPSGERNTSYAKDDIQDNLLSACQDMDYKKRVIAHGGITKVTKELLAHAGPEIFDLELTGGNLEDLRQAQNSDHN